MNCKLKDIFKLDLSTRVGIKRFNDITNKYIINKKEKKELFKEVKNINKEEDSFDDGMEYYLILNPTPLVNKLNLNESVAISALVNENGVVKCFHVHEKDQIDIFNIIAFQTSNKIQYGVYGVGSMILKEMLIGSLEYFNISLNDTNLFQKITAKEYYSLLNQL